MFPTSIIQAASEQAFAAKAFGDYCKSAAVDYQRLCDFLTEAVTFDGTDYEWNRFLNTVSEVFNLESWVSLDAGYIQLNDLLTRTRDITNADVEGRFYTPAGFPVLDTMDMPDDAVTALYAPILRLNVSGGSRISTSLNDVFMGINSSLRNVTCMSAAVEALSSNNVADRLASFESAMRGVFSDAVADISGVTEYYASLLRNASTTLTSFLEVIYRDAALEDLSADGNFSTPSSSDIYKYTGSSPMGPLDFSNAKRAVSTVVNAGAKMVKAAVSGLISLGRRLFHRATDYVRHTLVDPVDIYARTDSAEATPSIDGWCFFSTDNSIADVVGRPNTGSWIPDDGVYTFRLITGEIIVKFHGVKYDIMFKPYALNFSKCVFPTTDRTDFAPIFEPDYYNDDDIAVKPSVTCQDVLDYVKYLQNLDNLYVDTTDGIDEHDFMRGIILANALTRLIIRAATSELLSDGDMSQKVAYWEVDPENPSEPSLTYNADAIHFPFNIYSTTNADFVVAACGWNGSTFDPPAPQSCIMAQLPRINLGDFSYGLGGIVGVITGQLEYKNMYPFNYPFIPYQVGQGWSEARYAIKTDSENYQAFNAFATTAIIITAVVAVVIIAGISIKKLSSALYAKRAAALGKLQARIWNGEVLTGKELKKYRRLTKKLACTAPLVRGMNSSAEITSDIQQSSADTLEQLVSLISGS